jgi:hypothetical protein
MESTQQKFPWSPLILAGLILAAMFLYASFWQKSPAETTVQQFYTAYFDGNNPAMAEHVSVLWLRDQLATPEEYHLLLEQSAEIKTFLAETPIFLQAFALPEGTKAITIPRNQSLEGSEVAFVIFETAQSKIFKTPYVAILVKENGVFRLNRLIPLSEDVMPLINAELLAQWEEDLQALL